MKKDSKFKASIAHYPGVYHLGNSASSETLFQDI